MNLLKIRKYKDELPINTINKIRNILGDLGILTVESNWKNSAEGFYSVSIVIKGTNLSSNGKGTTSEYALASAYGELMERLQNQAFFRLSMDLSQEALEYRNFYYSPDEKYINIKEFIYSEEDWINIQREEIKEDINKKELLKKWLSISYEKVPSDFVSLPYINLTNKKISYIPIKMVSKMYMSNGMCAGNTIEEALVQGISEIFERVVNKAIIKEKITPPTVPYSYIQKFPKIDNMIKQIKAKGNYEVIVKDCSLDKGYPVVGIIFINKDNQKYFVKFGSHPIFEVAAERTLTELLQGQDIKNMLGVKEFSYKNEDLNESNNLIGILANGSGYYPTEFFQKKFTYKFEEFENVKASTNKEILKYLIKLLENKGLNVFVRDVSFLGFPSFHVIVPGFSEIESICDINSLDEYSKYNKAKKYIRNLNKISDKEIEELIKYINNVNYGSSASIIQLLNLPVRNIFPWYYVNMDLFITALYYKKGNFKKAYKYFNKYLYYVDHNSYNNSIYVYYKCVRDYIGCRIDNLNEEEIIKILKSFYPLIMIKDVINQFKNPKQIFKHFGEIKCWNCKKCELREQCLYNSIEKVYKILKKKYESNKIDQKSLIEKLSL